LNEISVVFGRPFQSSTSAKNDSIWDLGLTHFIGETLLDAPALRIMTSLGPCYQGNYQGNLEKHFLFDIPEDAKSDKGAYHIDFTNNGLSVNAPKLNEKSVSKTNSIMKSFQSSIQGKPTGSFVVGIPEDKLLFCASSRNVISSNAKERELRQNHFISNEARDGFTTLISNHAFQKGLFDGNIQPIQIKDMVLSVVPSSVINGLWVLGGSSVLIMIINNCQVS
jgi:hypothetical protein